MNGIPDGTKIGFVFYSSSNNELLYHIDEEHLHGLAAYARQRKGPLVCADKATSAKLRAAHRRSGKQTAESSNGVPGASEEN